MSEQCTHDCSSCGENCAERTRESFLEKPHEKSKIKKIYGVMSGKGGVGKSLVTSMLAVEMTRRGYRAAILDSDITGPSIPKAFGIKGMIGGDESGMIPKKTKTGIQIVSLNLFLQDETAPVVWRGPIIAGTVTQFWKETVWDDVDFLFIDMPPGTGDVALTVFQSIPLDGVIIVTTPQQLVGMIVEKALNMAKMMSVPIVALVENMSYAVCPDCGKEFKLFGESRVAETADRLDVVSARLPLDPKLAAACDEGFIELFDCEAIAPVADELEKKQ